MNSWFSFFVAMFIFLLSLPAFSISNNLCTFRHFLVEGDKSNTRLITATYLDIIRDVGQGSLTPELINLMVKSGDPFKIPDEASLSTNSLQSALLEFKELVKLHWEDDVPNQAELLIALRDTATAATAQQSRQSKSVLKNDLPILKELKWSNSPAAIYNKGDWFVGVGIFNSVRAGTKNKMEALHFHDGKEETIISFRLPMQDEAPYKSAFNAATGEVYYTDVEGDKLWKINVFDSFGVPLKTISVDEVPVGKGLPKKYAISDIKISQNGKFIVLYLAVDGVFVSELNQVNNAPFNFRKLGVVDEVTDENSKKFGFLGKDKIYLVKDQKMKIIDLSGRENELNIDLPPQFQSIHSNLDGTFMDLVFYPTSAIEPLKKKPYSLSIDYNKKDASGKPKESKSDLGHPENLSGFETGYFDEIVHIPNSDYFLHMYIGSFEDPGKRELRVVNLKTKEVKYVSSITIQQKEWIKDLVLTSDNHSVFGNIYKMYNWLTPNETKTWVWNIEALISRIEN